MISTATGRAVVEFESIQCMHQESTAEFGFEPCAFRRHDLTGIGDRHELVKRRRNHRDPDGPVSWDAQSFEFRCAADAAHEVDTRVRADVLDSKDRVQHLTFQDGCVQSSDRIVPEQRIGRNRQLPPAVINQKAEGTDGPPPGVFLDCVHAADVRPCSPPQVLAPAHAHRRN